MATEPAGFPRGLLRRAPRERLAYFADYTLSHASIQEALAAVLRVVSQPIDTWTPVTLVIGPAGVGKTTLVRAVERELARRLRRELRANPGRLSSVSIASDIPELGSFNWKDFCLQGLEALQEPLVGRKVHLSSPDSLVAADLRAAYTARTPANLMRRALITALIHRAPAAFLIDEAQQLAMVTGARKFQHQMDYIKRLADTTRVPVVLVGNYGLCLLRNQSAQLGRRTTDVHFRRYDATRSQDAADFQDIVLSFQHQLPLVEQPDLVSNWDYLYLRSVGCIGLLKKWLLDALDRAIEAGDATITRASLERTAPSPSKSTKVLEEALEGETTLAELGPDADPRAAEAALRVLLRLAPTAVAGAPATALADTSPGTAKQRRRRPGERVPIRDPVETATVGELTG